MRRGGREAQQKTQLAARPYTVFMQTTPSKMMMMTMMMRMMTTVASHRNRS